MLGPARLARNAEDIDLWRSHGVAENIDLWRSHDADAVAVAAAAAAIVEGGDARRSGPRGRFVNCSGR